MPSLKMLVSIILFNITESINNQQRITKSMKTRTQSQYSEIPVPGSVWVLNTRIS